MYGFAAKKQPAVHVLLEYLEHEGVEFQTSSIGGPRVR